MPEIGTPPNGPNTLVNSPSSLRPRNRCGEGFDTKQITHSCDFVELNKGACKRLDTELTLCIVAHQQTEVELALAALQEVILARPNTPSHRVICSTEINIRKFESCVGVHGSTPCIAIFDRGHDSVYVLPIRDWSANTSNLNASAALSFVDKAVVGAWPRAKTGIPRPMGDRDCEYPNVFAAVQCSFKELVYNEHADVLTILWSQGCPCCPDALALLSRLFGHIHAANPNGSATLYAVQCDIDQNELEDEDWPSDTDSQVVPLIRFYPATHIGPDGRRATPGAHTKLYPATFKGARTARAIAQFVLANIALASSTFDLNSVVEMCEDEDRPRKKSPSWLSPTTPTGVEAQ